MATVEEILSVSAPIIDKNGKKGRITLAIVDGDEVTGYSLIDDPYVVGERVSKFHYDKHDRSEMRKLNKPLDSA